MSNITRPYDPIPLNWQPYQSRVPSGTAQRIDGKIHPVSNPTNPGYAYGTMMPLNVAMTGAMMYKYPYTVPVGRTFSNQVPMKPQIQGVTPNQSRAIAVNGTIGYIPGPNYDSSSVDAVQALLNQMNR